MRNTIINRRFRYAYWNVTSIFIALNVAVFCLTYFLFPRLTYTLAMVPAYVLYEHTYWQFLTYMFTHGSVSHLAFNMLSLYIFGSAVERRVGSREFILYYLLTGVLSGIASYVMYYIANTNVVLLGDAPVRPGLRPTVHRGQDEDESAEGMETLKGERKASSAPVPEYAEEAITCVYHYLSM